MEKKHVVVIAAKVIWFAVSLFAGFFIMLLFTLLPIEGRLFSEIPANVIVFVTAILSVYSLSRLYKHELPRRTRLIVTATILVYAAISYLIANDTPQGTYFNFNVLLTLTVISCFLAILPSLGERSLIQFSLDKARAKQESILFASSVMWISPLISELFIWIKWCIEGTITAKWGYMTLGWFGFRDILFEFGFWAFASLILYNLMIRIFKLDE